MPEFAAYFENSFGCNVFLWLNVIYISLFFLSYCVFLVLFLDVLFSYIEIHSGSTELSLCQCAASSTPLLTALSLSLPHFLFTGFALLVALSFSGFLLSLSLSLSLHTQTTATAAAALLARLIPFASQFLQLRFVPTFAANRKIRKHITTNALCEQFFLLFLNFFTMFSPCCALAFVFVFLSAAPFASFGPLPLASVRPQIAQST